MYVLLVKALLKEILVVKVNMLLGINTQIEKKNHIGMDMDLVKCFK